MKEEIKDILGNVYSNFIMRDLTYISSGLLVILSIIYLLSSFNVPVSNIDKLLDKNVFIIILFIVIVLFSYFISFITQEFFILFKIIKTSTDVPLLYKEKYNSKDNILLMSDIDNFFSLATVKRLERMIFIKQVGAAFGSSFCLIFIIILIHYIKTCQHCDWYLLIPSLIFGILCLLQSNNRLKKHNNALEDLAKRIIYLKSFENILVKIKNDKSFFKKVESEYEEAVNIYKKEN